MLQSCVPWWTVKDPVVVCTATLPAVVPYPAWGRPGESFLSHLGVLGAACAL